MDKQSIVRNCRKLMTSYREYKNENCLKIGFVDFLKHLQYSKKDITNILDVIKNSNSALYEKQ